MAKTLIAHNQKLARQIARQIAKQLARISAAPLECYVSEGVICVCDNQEQDVISTQVAVAWFNLLEVEPVCLDGFERAWQALNQAQDKYA